MYKVQDKIIHFRDGVAKIVDIKKIGELDYYLVVADRGTGESIYVPISRAENIIRPIIDVATADKVLSFMKDATVEVSANTKQRRDSFKKKLSSGNPFDIGFLSKQLYLYNNQANLGIVVKFGPADLEMLKYAHMMLLDELAITYKIDREKIADFIHEKFLKLAQQ